MNRIAPTLVVLALLTTAGIVASSGPGTSGAPELLSPVAPESATTPPTDSVPRAVLSAADEGRYWRASRLLDAYLATVADTTPEQLLLAARLDAGWGDWARVRRRLEGRDWLDRVDGGAGLELLGRSLAETGRPAEAAEALGRWAELAPASGPGAVARLRQARALADAEETRRALETFDRAAESLPWFSDHIALMAARAAAEGGDTVAVRTRLAAAGELAPRNAWRLRLEASLAAGDTLAAREVALAVARSDPSDAVRATAWAELAALRLAAGDTARAREAFVTATEVPASLGAVRAALALTELDPSPEEWRTIGAIYARHGNQERAAEGYRAWLDTGRGSELERWEARLALGRARYNAGRYGQAERGLLELAAEPVPARIGALALYLAGRAQYRQGRSAEGQKTLARLPERFPGEPSVTEGLYLLADLKHDDQELDDARRFYRQAAESSPAMAEAGLALMRLGGLALLEADYEEANAIFEEYRTLHPDGRRWSQSTYWAARARRALGREAESDSLLRELRRVDPLSYYGMRAAALLDEPLLAIPMADAPPVDSAAEAVVVEKLRRVDLLGELGMRDELVREVDRVRAELRGRTAVEYALAEALNARGYTLSAINIGWELYRRDRSWNLRLLRIIYPFPFRSMVLPEAREQRLDPYLVAGLIRRESAFNPTVSSGAGAIGLMQIMPPTGRTLARAAGPEDFEPELLRQPEVNVHLGTRYLRGMLDRFDGELPLVLSAYNAGPTRAERWKDLPEARDAELFIDRIPYNETREYVRKVLVHRALYEALYPGLGD